MLTVKEAAKQWKITERRVAALCRDGRIPGACKQGRSWRIPSCAEKPSDSRIKKTTGPRLPLPIGISDYRLASSRYYYIDKTMMIKEFLDERPMVSLFTRPRRFGTTLNMDMLRTFFEKTAEDTSVYFKDKKIWKCGKNYRDYQGKYPVIFITFKDVKRDTWEETYTHISKIVREEFERHRELLDSPRCSRYEKVYFKNMLEGKADSTDVMTSLQKLSQMLDEHYGIGPIIIIDEYDTPIQQGYMQGFYEEVKEIARYYGAQEKYEEICAWYDGYRFGNSEIFNPWSVINYFRNHCRPQAFWQSTGNNEIIGEILADADADIYEHLNELLQGKSILTYIDTGVIYPQIRNNPSSVYSFLLVAGYLKALKAETAFGGDYMCEVSLPNREIAVVYNKEILQKLEYMIPQATAVSVQEAPD